MYYWNHSCSSLLFTSWKKEQKWSNDQTEERSRNWSWKTIKICTTRLRKRKREKSVHSLSFVPLLLLFFLKIPSAFSDVFLVCVWVFVQKSTNKQWSMVLLLNLLFFCCLHTHLSVELFRVSFILLVRRNDAWFLS